MSSVFIKDKHRYERVEFNDILYLSATSNYTHVVTVKKEYMISITMGSVLRYLLKFDKQKKLVQVNRSIVVNSDYVDAIDGHMIYLRDKSFQVGRGYRKSLVRFNVLRHKHVIG